MRCVHLGMAVGKDSDLQLADELGIRVTCMRELMSGNRMLRRIQADPGGRDPGGRDPGDRDPTERSRRHPP